MGLIPLYRRFGQGECPGAVQSQERNGPADRSLQGSQDCLLEDSTCHSVIAGSGVWEVWHPVASGSRGTAPGAIGQVYFPSSRSTSPYHSHRNVLNEYMFKKKKVNSTVNILILIVQLPRFLPSR